MNKHPELYPSYFNRQDFEREIAEYPGESYVVILGPGTRVVGKGTERGEVVPEREGENPLWVVERRWREGRGGVFEVRGHYVVVADRILMGPSVWDVLQARWVSTSSYLSLLYMRIKGGLHNEMLTGKLQTSSMLQLSTFYRTASTLPLYSIEKGYSYLSPSQLKKKSTNKSTTTSTHTSRAASPTGSISSLSRSKDGGTTNDDLEIGRSFGLAMSYADEYMDENPLIGEPGNFKLSSTSRNIKDKEAKEKERQALEMARSEKARSEMGANTTRETSPVIAPMKTTGLKKEGGGLGKGKSPTSGGESVKKRRKSKAPITPGPASAS